MRYILITFFLTLISLVSAQTGRLYPKYLGHPTDSNEVLRLTWNPETNMAEWMEGGDAIGGDSLFTMPPDTLCAISMGDTICVSTDSLYVLGDSVCVIQNGDTTCVTQGSSADTHIGNTNLTLDDFRTLDLNNLSLTLTSLGTDRVRFTASNTVPGQTVLITPALAAGLTPNMAGLEIRHNISNSIADAYMRFRVSGVTNRLYSIGTDRSTESFVLAEGDDLRTVPVFRYYGGGDSLAIMMKTNHRANVGIFKHNPTVPLDVVGMVNIKNTTATANIFINGGISTATGAGNIAMGVLAGDALTSGTRNIILGTNAGTDLTDGTDNILMGQSAGQNITSGTHNIAFGNGAANALTTGNDNIVIGENAMLFGNGSGSVLIGSLAAVNTTVTDSSVIIGHEAADFGTTGVSRGNTIIGYRAGLDMNGSGSVFIGKGAGYGLGSNKLAINNSITTTPLIGGDFSARYVTIGGRLETTQGADVASVAGAITLGGDGNTFEITGTESITLIANTNWQNGSQVTLIFTGAATLVDGTATSGDNITLVLAGNTNFTASADDVITLMLCEIGGTQAWREVSRSIN